MQIIIKNQNTLLFDDFKFKCSLGNRGITSRKKEGDQKTPRGIYSIGPLYYRKDKFSNPETILKKISIKKNMGWCDDVTNKYYNKLIKIDKEIKHEKMFRKDNKYNLVIPIMYNTNQPLKSKGSAIFIHITEDYKKTLGCVALKKKDLLILLKIINKNTKIKII